MSSSSGDTQATNGITRFQDSKELLQYLYADLARFPTVVSPDIILYPFYNHSASIHGLTAVGAWVERLVAATNGTMRMDVESISVEGDYGTVDGMLRAQKPGLRDLAVRFQGRWKFAGGVPVEHWENVLDDLDGTVKWYQEAGWKRPEPR